jgi:hypothetical protein
VKLRARSFSIALRNLMTIPAACEPYEATKEAVARAAQEHFQIPNPDIDNGPRPDPSYKGKGVQIQVSVEDKGAFTMPWSATVTFRRALDEWAELVCSENLQWHPGTYSEVPMAEKPDF